MSDSNPWKFSGEHHRLPNLNQQRAEAQEADRRWEALFTQLTGVGFTPTVAAYAATAVVFGTAAAAALIYL